MDVAVITGASMGLGEEFARQLAARKINLYLTARSEDRLKSLAADLSAKHGAHVSTFREDLSLPGAAARVASHLEKEGLRPAWLINNAGFGDAGSFLKMPPERISSCVMLNMVALTELTRLLAPRMKSGDRIINVASTASFQPVPYFGVYSATKAYVLSFTEALHEELLPLGIGVLCLCPGPTNTRFADNNGMDKKAFERGQTSEHVVRVGLRASDKGRALLVTQRILAIIAQRGVPRLVVRKAAGAVAKSFKTSE